jgi:hypothetical protein
MNYRKSVIGLIIAIPVFIALNFVIWTFYTETLLTSRYGTGGDLARIGYTVDSKQLRRAVVDLPRRHIEFREYKGQPVDMITIGDSFANGGGEGRNNFFQDYIATTSGITVLNLGPYGKGPVETVMALLNSGMLDKIKPRYLMIESVERFCAMRFAREINFNVTEEQEKLVKHYNSYVDLFNYLPKLSFINNGNVQYLYYRFLYLFSDSPTGKVKIMKLSKPLFNVKNADKLLIFRDEYRDAHKLNKQSVKVINDNLNKLAEILEKKNITLYFMPPPDKYNLYREFILNNPYPESVFFEELRPLPKKYRFIDTKEILLEALRKGEKDIYYADDTHWSWRAPELIFDRVRFEK